ncbi:MFS transporter [Hephaestia mangrovi]|uniref:MFS transporter n=1 Tax=Hephaestia mangrovi TaxID=2873268 RepID=UPI001CA781B3|nr:MFS transporter [Hephaestia mangrovi]MBY8829543.1 MFS transporter [Hephaestia mangrovi]
MSGAGTGTDRGTLRWVIVALLFASTVINYLDRQALSILASTVQKSLDISDLGYAHIVQLFMIAYTIAYLVAGRITDWLGTKLSLALFVAWWSVANLLTGLVNSAGQLGAARFALGLGEAGNYTAGPKAIGEHFPPKERAFAFGLYTAGAMVGATIAPPLIAGLALAWGWRSAFVATGLAGLVWLGFWWLIYPRSAQAAQEASEPIRWREVLSDRAVWLLALSRGLADPVWYFYLFWFPKYLTDARGMSLTAVASLAWIVYLASDLGSVGGGAISSLLVKRGIDPARSRIIAMTMAAAAAPFGAFIATSPPLTVVFALGALVAFAHLTFQINISTLIIDLYPQRKVATVFGVIAAGSGLGGIFSTQAVGMLVSGGSYSRVFLLMALLHPAALMVAWLGWRARRHRPRASADSRPLEPEVEQIEPQR